MSQTKAATKKPRANASTRQSAAVKSRPYDVVLYGATGFVGKQTVQYFSQLWLARGQTVRWAIAGRSASKLAEVKADIGPGAAQADILVADANDEAALDTLTRSAKVVLSTAGPFAIFGSKLVGACARNGTHYVDITGETPWVYDMMKQHQEQAVRSGARIIPFCGFDSVPSDIGTWMMVQAMQQRHGEACVMVKASYTMRGGVNGGTLASAMNMLGSDLVTQFAQPFLLNPAGPIPFKTASDHDPVAPINDADFGAWQVPFVMGPINTRVVRRSAALLNYGPDFHYQEYMRVGTGPLAGVAAAGFSLGMVTSKFAMTIGPVKKITEKLMPGAGKGPSESAMNNGSYRSQLIATSASGKTLRGTVADKGDPGNRATTKMVCEAALCLAWQLKDLPGGPSKGGFMTPASGLGETYAKRLRAAGMTLSVQPD